MSGSPYVPVIPIVFVGHIIVLDLDEWHFGTIMLVIHALNGIVIRVWDSSSVFFWLLLLLFPVRDLQTLN